MISSLCTAPEIMCPNLRGCSIAGLCLFDELADTVADFIELSDGSAARQGANLMAPRDTSPPHMTLAGACEPSRCEEVVAAGGAVARVVTVLRGELFVDSGEPAAPPYSAHDALPYFGTKTLCFPHNHLYD